MRKGAARTALALAVLACAAPLRAQDHLDWHGYAQIRFSYGRSIYGFGIRRAKLWVKGPVPMAEGLHFKLQGIFRPRASGAFILQDVYAEYRRGLGMLRAGQMVPDFSLERRQPDYEIPLVERASVINALIPAGTTLARDIGVQVTVAGRGAWHASVGLFNGNGANHPVNEDKQFLVTGRVALAARPLPAVDLALGASASYRDADGMDFSKILGGGEPFAGKDFRWGVETRLSALRWGVQAEYLQANLGGQLAWGYYAFADYYLTARNQIVVSTERLDVPNPDLPSNPWYILGFNHYIAGHNAKVMLDARVQFTDARTNYRTAAQLQLFLR